MEWNDFPLQSVQLVESVVSYACYVWCTYDEMEFYYKFWRVRSVGRNGFQITSIGANKVE